MLAVYSADLYDFYVRTQADDGPLAAPHGKGWILVAVSAAGDGNAAILLATWAREKALQPVAEKSLDAY